MKRDYFFLVFFLAFFFSSYGQSADDKTIRAVLNEVATANKTGNYTSLEGVYASDFIFINASGKKFNKSERMSNLKATPHPESFSFENIKIRTYGTTAVVNAEVHLKRSGKAAETDLVTIVMVKEGGRWVEVNGQATLKG